MKGNVVVCWFLTVGTGKRLTFRDLKKNLWSWVNRNVVKKPFMFSYEKVYFSLNKIQFFRHEVSFEMLLHMRGNANVHVKCITSKRYSYKSKHPSIL